MNDADMFEAWYRPWIKARPATGPIGWYVLADLEAAFSAGYRATDDRPGAPHQHPPSGAGPVPPDG